MGHVKHKDQLLAATSAHPDAHNSVVSIAQSVLLKTKHVSDGSSLKKQADNSNGNQLLIVNIQWIMFSFK